MLLIKILKVTFFLFLYDCYRFEEIKEKYETLTDQTCSESIVDSAQFWRFNL